MLMSKFSATRVGLSTFLLFPNESLSTLLLEASMLIGPDFEAASVSQVGPVPYSLLAKVG